MWFRVILESIPLILFLVLISDRSEIQSSLSSFRSPHKLLIVVTRVCRNKNFRPVRFHFGLSFLNQMRFQTGLSFISGMRIIKNFTPVWNFKPDWISFRLQLYFRLVCNQMRFQTGLSFISGMCIIRNFTSVWNFKPDWISFRLRVTYSLILLLKVITFLHSNRKQI